MLKSALGNYSVYFVVLTEAVCCFANVYVGHAVAQLVKALRYKLEGRGFDSRWSHWNFPST